MRIDDYCSLENGGLVLKNSLQSYTRENIITDHPAMNRQLDMLERAGEAPIPLTILGEKGSGKDMIAQFAHRVSRRSDEPFLKVNCAYLPEERLLLELFGSANAPGTLKRVAGGSFYIENADLLSSKAQYQLMHYINTEAGTPRDVRYMICLSKNKTTDCPDFAYYFGAMTFEIPPLRERPQDILLVAYQQLHKIKQEYHLERLLSPAVMSAMLTYEWPGNIRQLINTIDRMAFFCDTAVMDSVPMLRNCLSSHKQFKLVGSEAASLPKTKSLKEIIQEYEIMIINQYIEEYGSLRKAATALKVSPSVLSAKLTKYYATSPVKDKLF